MSQPDYSQSGEGVILDGLLARMGITVGNFFDCGASDGCRYSNTRHLLDRGWSGVMIECDDKYLPKLRLLAESVSPRLTVIEKAVSLWPGLGLNALLPLVGYDVGSVDIDSFDWWVVWEMTRVCPRVLIVEYNSNNANTEPLVVPRMIADYAGDDFFGANALAWKLLADAKGYRLVAHTNGLNLFFVRNDVAGDLPVLPVTAIAECRVHTSSPDRKLVPLLPALLKGYADPHD